MRTIVAVCWMVTVGATAAGAADIQGKWGLGAGVFGGGAQVSLFRGKSERSAWLFDVAIFQQDLSQDRQSSFNPFHLIQGQEFWTLRVGPGYRRFLRPDARFSPYWDVGVMGLYSHTHTHSSLSQTPFGASFTMTSAGVAGQFAFGLEYFFRQHLSVAAHGSVVDVEWRHTSQSVFSSFFGTASSSGHVVDSSIGLSPVIFVRGYW
jgi:hypothetical protein